MVTVKLKKSKGPKWTMAKSPIIWDTVPEVPAGSQQDSESCSEQQEQSSEAPPSLGEKRELAVSGDDEALASPPTSKRPRRIGALVVSKSSAFVEQIISDSKESWLPGRPSHARPATFR